MSALPLLPEFMAHRIERWAARRLPQITKQIVLDRRRIYILPTRNGLMFSLVLLVILAGAINYQNSMGYLLTFLTLAIMLLGMIDTHQNINQLAIAVIHAEPVHAGQSARFALTISRINRRDYIHINLQCEAQQAIVTHLMAQQTATQIYLPVTSTKRGYLALPRIRVFTEFPLGLFHAWSWIELEARCLIYPAPLVQSPTYTLQGLQTGQRQHEQTGEDDFAGIRPYQHGDSSKRMAWKAIARNGNWQTKIFHADAGNEIWLDWQHTPENFDTEKRLSILCYWILDTHRQGLKFGLNIPGTRIAANSGSLHQQQCLQALALYGNTKDDSSANERK